MNTFFNAMQRDTTFVNRLPTPNKDVRELAPKLRPFSRPHVLGSFKDHNQTFSPPLNSIDRFSRLSNLFRPLLASQLITKMNDMIKSLNLNPKSIGD